MFSQTLVNPSVAEPNSCLRRRPRIEREGRASLHSMELTLPLSTRATAVAFHPTRASIFIALASKRGFEWAEYELSSGCR